MTQPVDAERGPSVVRCCRTAVVLAMVLVACGGDGGAGGTGTSSSSSTSSSTTGTTAQPTTTTSDTIAQSTTTTASVQEEIFGWLRSFESGSGGTIVGIDKAEMLSGDEALAAARKDGAIGPNEDLPNDFYISDPDESIAMFTVAPDVVITLQACFPEGPCVTTVPVDLDTWSILLGGEDDPGLEWSWYGAGSLPYVFTVLGDQVLSMEEVYLP